jgi:hypothetical protein
MERLLDLPSALKVRIASYLSPRDAVRMSKTCRDLYQDLALAQLPMKIPFKSWYDDPLPDATTIPHPKRGPKIPFLPNRTHSVTLTGSWSCRLGELQGRQCGSNSHAQFYVVAYPVEHDKSLETTDRRERSTRRRNHPDGEGNEEEDWLSGGGRIVWSSQPISQRHHHPANSNSSWVKLTVTFVPSKEEEYYLCIQPGPGAASQQHWWRHSLHMSNLVAHVTFHDDPHSDFLMKRQYKTIVKHMLQVENRGAYYTKILEAVARSIRIQLARFGRNALDPVLESFFQSTGIPRDTDSLLVLEEIARFLSYYAYVNERQKMYSNGDRESAKGGSSSNRDSIPDWVPYAESSIANKSSRDLSHSHNVEEPFGEDVCYKRENSWSTAQPAFATVHEQNTSPSRKRFKRRVQKLWKIPSFLRRSGSKGRKTKRPSWRTDEITEEFSISVVPPEEFGRPLDATDGL